MASPAMFAPDTLAMLTQSVPLNCSRSPLARPLRATSLNSASASLPATAPSTYALTACSVGTAALRSPARVTSVPMAVIWAPPRVSPPLPRSRPTKSGLELVARSCGRASTAPPLPLAVTLT